jgi:hypothetical protein
VPIGLRPRIFLQLFPRHWALSFEQFLKGNSRNLITMKTKNLFTVAAVSAGLAFGVAAQAKEHEEQDISSSDVPAAVQQAAQTAAKGANIVRWEKEGANYEAVINQNGKEIGIAINPSGKVLSRHSEASEHKEKGEKY